MCTFLEKQDGKLYAGGGNIKLDAYGLTMSTASSVSYGGTTTSDRSINFKTSAGVLRGQIFAWDAGTGAANLELSAIPGSGQDGYINLTAYDAGSAHTSQITVGAAGGAGSNGRIYVTADEIWLWNSIRGPVDVQISGDVTATAFNAGGGNTQYKGKLITLANNANAALGPGASGFGFAFIHAGGAGAMFAINGTAHTTTEISDPSGIYSITSGTASSINVYWSAANSRYEVENKRGSTINIRVWFLEAV